MTPERWRQITEVFHAALTRDAAARASYLEQACADDGALRQEVEAMLAAHATRGDVSLATSPRLASGTMIGPYRVADLIGAGGMGEVYKAIDTNLKRSVAIKVLPASVLADAERLARFQREAELLGSLNHPNIAAIYGLERSGVTPALVMELVEGPTLADRIARGAIVLDEALPIAKQIAEALEAAHEQGIIHRDLKPANIKVRPDGTVKVLDFGLAKAIERAGVPTAQVTQSATITSPTGPGVILGTAAYMSPEQAKGRAADKRSDIWAFGCVLYEMLTGRRAFEGEDVSETLAAVLRGEPDWKLLPAGTPTTVRRLLRRCLKKDARERLHDISDARIEIQDAQADAASETTTLAVPVVTRRRERLVWAVAATVVVIATVVASVPYVRRAETEAPAVRFTIGPPEKGLFDFDDDFLTVSPDGSRLAFIATGSSGKSQLWIRALDSFAAQLLPGTDGATSPFWSADGRFLAFHADGSLKKIAVSGGPAQTLTGSTAFGGVFGGGAWSHDGVVLFAKGDTIHRVSEAGGAATPVTTLDASRQEALHGYPHFLPDGKHFLYYAMSLTKRENNAIYVGSLDSKERTLLLSAFSNAAYAPPGYLLYHREGTLVAQPFDAERMQLTGEPVPIAEGVEFGGTSGRAAFRVSESGVLAYRRRGAGLLANLVWVDRSGAEQVLAAPARVYENPRLSPDGQRAVVEVGPGGGQGDQLWVYDLARDTLTRLTFEGGNNEEPVWTPDGKRIAFGSDRDGAPTKIFWQLADSSSGLEPLTSSGELDQAPTSWSPDGQLLAFHTLGDIWVFRLSDRKAEPFLRTPFQEGGARFSPDGRWLAYVSNESGRPEVYVQPYPGPGGKRQVSIDGGTEPVWSHNGRELFYRNGNELMAVVTTTQPSFSAGKPRALFEGPYFTTEFPTMSVSYDVSADGQRFLMVKQGEQGPPPINVVQNWLSDLKRRVPTK